MASREELRQAYGKLLFKPLTSEALLAINKRLDARTLAPLGWDTVAPFVAHAISTPEAAAGVMPHMLEAVLVLDRALRAHVYLGGSFPVVADVAVYLAARPAFAAMSAAQRWAVCSASRWCAHMQHQLYGHEGAAAADTRVPGPLRIAFDCDMPPGEHVLTFATPNGCEVKVDGGYVQPSTERGVNAKGEGRKGDKGAVGGGGGSAPPAPPAPPPPAPNAASHAAGGAKKVKADRADKATADSAPPAATARGAGAKGGAAAVGADAPVAATAGGELSEMSRLDLRVGVVLEASKHPDADNLYIEQVDCGDGAPRTVVSGLAGLVPLEQLQGARVVVVCNLKPATMKGVESRAMVLCASEEKDGTRLVQLVTPPAGAPPGERVAFAGHEGPAETNPNAVKKKKLWEAVAPELRTDAAGVATYRGIPFQTSHGACRVTSLAHAQIK